MKKKCWLLLLSVFCLSAMAQEIHTHLVVWAKDGTQVAYALTEQPVITFSETDLLIKTNLVEVNYPLAQMARFSYEKRNETTGLRDLKTDELICAFVGESLVFPYLEKNSIVTFYTPVGQVLFSRTITSAGEYAFPLSYLNAGVYMVNVNGVTCKIVKR